MTQITPSTHAEDRELLRTAAVTAGIMAAGYFRQNVRNWTKDNASPVSEADIVVDNFLAGALLGARPDYGWLSEESVASSERLSRRRCFIVDPIDGTRGFIKGEDSWTICLAVVEDGLPVAGVVYAPARDQLFEASLGAGARLNGVSLDRPAGNDVPIIPAASAVHKELRAAGLHYEAGPAYPSLAYRLVSVATGRLDAAVARRGANDWDIAAADIILREAGVSFEDVCAGQPRFNRMDTRHGALAAIADKSLKPLLHGALIKVYGCPGEEQSA